MIGAHPRYRPPIVVDDKMTPPGRFAGKTPKVQLIINVKTGKELGLSLPLCCSPAPTR
jgi:hypothetical protein